MFVSAEPPLGDRPIVGSRCRFDGAPSSAQTADKGDDAMQIGKLVTAAALTGSLVIGGAALACSSPPGPPQILIEQVGPNTYCIWVCNYTAAGASAGDFCVCAINNLGVITGGFLTEQTFWADPFDPGNPNFAANPNTGFSFDEFFPSTEGNWEGFFALTVAPIQGNRPINLKFTVNVAPATSVNDLADAISGGPGRAAPPFIGTGKGNPDGTIMPDPMHPPEAMPALSVTILGAPIPTVSEWGLIITGILLLSGGVVAMRFYSARAAAPQGA
jgi:hypothetical protein